ncbi:MAG: hypothetical protein ACLP2Y_12715 [Limisphaerales bacterium]
MQKKGGFLIFGFFGELKNSVKSAIVAQLIVPFGTVGLIFFRWGAMSLSRRGQRWQSVIGAINPRPVFNSFAQLASNWIVQDVTDFFRLFVVVTQAMVEEITLPDDFFFPRQKPFPVRNCFLHSGFAGKSNDGVKVVRHQQHEPTMPNQRFMIVRGSGQNGLTYPFTA